MSRSFASRVMPALVVLGVLAACEPIKKAPPPPPPAPAHDTLTYVCTGAAQSFTVPPGVNLISVDAYGAQGGGPRNGNPGGLGGRATAPLGVTPGETLGVNVGCSGAPGSPGGTGGGAGGFPEGGNGGGSEVGADGGAGGGGSSSVTRSGNPLLVAGGGGGPGNGGGATGSGGGATGGSGSGMSLCHGGDGTQTMGGAGGQAVLVGDNPGQPGAPGQGGNGGVEIADNQGGSGGGFYGGGGGTAQDAGGCGGGGGSGRTPDGTGMQNGVRSGSGMVVISY